MNSLKVMLVLAVLFKIAFSGSLSLEYSSIENGDSVNTCSGLIMSFNEKIDISSFKTDSIEYLKYQLDSIDYVDSTKLFIYKPENIRLNNNPVSLWYDKTIKTLAFIENTTVEMQLGTGIGFKLKEGHNKLEIFDITCEIGNTLSDTITLNIYGVKSKIHRIIPNPYQYPSPMDPPLFLSNKLRMRIMITTQLDSSNVTFFTIDGDTLHSGHSELNRYFWNLKDNNGEIIKSGIYKYEIKSINNNFKNGMFFIVIPNENILSVKNNNSHLLTNINGFSIKSLYPNPFNSELNIKFQLFHQKDIKISVYDISGRKIEVISNKLYNPGLYNLKWNPKNLATGLYYITFKSENYQVIRKIVYLK